MQKTDKIVFNTKNHFKVMNKYKMEMKMKMMMIFK